MIHQKASQTEIILFSRYPKAGKAKTRLIPKLGAVGAAKLQQTMAEQAVRTAMNTIKNTQGNLGVYFTDGTLLQMQEWLGPDLTYHEQKGSDLGERMYNAFTDSRHRGMQQTVVIGADCPALNSQLIRSAFALLDESSLVLGPSVDGGYYLIGTSNALPEDVLKTLFTDIPWGTSTVLPITRERAQESSVSVSLLKELHDIDSPHDLEYFDYHSNS